MPPLLFCCRIFAALLCTSMATSAVKAEQRAVELFELVASADSGGNILLSPHGICEALSMLERGAVGRAKAELSEFLGGLCASGSESVEEAGLTWRWRNVIIHRKEFRLRDSYLDKTKLFQPLVVDVSDEHGLEQLNALVRRYLGEGPMTWLRPAQAQLILVSLNAFSGDWQIAFDEVHTRSRKFHNQDGSAVDVPMMHLQGSFPFGETSNGIRYAVMRYGNPRFAAMIAYSPNGGNEDVVQLLRAFDLSHALHAPEVQLTIAMPRFSLENKLSLKQALRNRGVTSIFQHGASGLDEILEEELDPPFVDDVLHQVALEVSERGTTSRSATAVHLIGAAPPREFVVDRPFVFVVMDLEIRRALFLAAVRALDNAGHTASHSD